MKNHNKQISTSKQKIISAFIIGIGLQAVSATDSDFIPRKDKPSHGIMTQSSIDTYKERIAAFKIDHRPDFIALAVSASILPFWLPFHEKNMHQLSSLILYEKQFFEFAPKDYIKSLKYTAPILLIYPLVNWKLRTAMQNAETHLHRELYLFEKFAIAFGVGASTALFTTPYQTLTIEALKQRKITHKTCDVVHLDPLLVKSKTLRITTLLDYVSLSTAWSNIIKNHGIQYFWKGTTSMMVRNGIFSGSLFIGVPACENGLSHHLNISKTSMASSLLGSILPAIIATCAMVPLDLNLMVMKGSIPGPGNIYYTFYGLINNHNYKTIGQVCRGTYTLHGIRGLWMIYGSRFLANTVEFTGFHTLRRVYEEKK